MDENWGMLLSSLNLSNFMNMNFSHSFEFNPNSLEVE